MTRNETLLTGQPDPLREAVGLPIGKYGDFYVGDTHPTGLTRTDDVIDYNTPPGAGSDLDPSLMGYGPRDPRIQPSLWCQWTANDTGTALIWDPPDDEDRWHSYGPWLNYLATQILSRWGVTLSPYGQTVSWRARPQGIDSVVPLDDH